MPQAPPCFGVRTCGVLAASLEDVKGRLAIAVSQMRSVTGVGRREAFQAAFRDAQSLRMECELLIAEVERHKAEH